MAQRKHWIQKAIRHPGSLTAAAKRAHESIDHFAKSHLGAKGAVGRRARFYEDVLKPAAEKSHPGKQAGWGPRRKKS